MDFDVTTSRGKVRVNIGDRKRPYHFEDEELDGFLSDASSNVNGASCLALRSWASEIARDYVSVNAGGLTRSKADPAAAMMKQAEWYEARSDNTVGPDNEQPAFGVARIDWQQHLNSRTGTIESPDARTLRIHAETLEDA